MKYKNSKKEKLHYEAVFLHEEKRKEIIDYSRAVFESGSLRGKMEKGFCKVTNMMVEEMNHNAFVHN